MYKNINYKHREGEAGYYTTDVTPQSAKQCH